MHATAPALKRLLQVEFNQSSITYIFSFETH